jgi:hypothetical protein
LQKEAVVEISFSYYFFVYLDIMAHTVRTFIPSNSHNKLIVAVRRGSCTSPYRLLAQWEKPPWGAEPRIELEPCLTASRRTTN